MEKVGKKVTFKNFDLVVDDQGNGFANEQWSLALWPRLDSVLLANQIEFLDMCMFWWFDGRIKNILYFRELYVVNKIGAKVKKEAEMKELSLPNSFGKVC